jgi:hypothetical protein
MLPASLSEMGLVVSHVEGGFDHFWGTKVRRAFQRQAICGRRHTQLQFPAGQA